MSESDLEYYETRLEQERARERHAGSPEVASAHRALALIYAEEVRRLQAMDQRNAAVPTRAGALAPG